MNHFLRILAFAKPYWGKAVLNAVANLFYTVFSLASIGALIPVLDIIFNQHNRVHELQPWASNLDTLKNNAYYYITIWLDQYGEQQALLYICLVAISMFFLKNTFRYLALYFLAPLRNGIIHDLRVAVHRKCLHLPVYYFTEKRKGDIMARMSSDVSEIEWSMLTGLELIVREPIMILGSVGVLFYMSPQLTLFIFLVLPISIFIITVIGKSLKRSSIKAQAQLGYVLSVIEETLTGLRVIKAFRAENRIDKKFDEASGGFRHTMNRVIRKKDLSSPLSEFLGAAVLIMVVWYGGKLVLIEKELTGGALIAYVGFFYQIIPAFKSITQALYNIQKGNASSARILEILDADNPIKDEPGAEDLDFFSDEIKFDDVYFRYSEQGPDVLRQINFALKKGKSVALVGPSGSGKTTISNLLPRFYDISRGKITLDGKNIKQLKLNALRGLMGVVNQESILFNDTVANNISLGRPNATQEEIEQAAKIANAYDFIKNLEKGFDTNIGDGGSKLSGGQKQRLSIARAVLNDPPILILDEATSALDTESEKLVQDALNKLMQNRTSLIIAHRLSTIMHADEILVMENGRIVERGSHFELLEHRGTYAKLVEMQSFE